MELQVYLDLILSNNLELEHIPCWCYVEPFGSISEPTFSKDNKVWDFAKERL